MKRIQILIFLATAVLIGFTQSCTDRDDDEMLATGTDDNLFKTEEDFLTAMSEAYANLYTIGKHGSFMTSNEIASDEVMIPQRGQAWFDNGTWLLLHRQEYNASLEPLNNAWNDLYGGIKDCNRLIDLFEGLANADPYIAELKVLRGYFYWQLLDMFGNIPIITSPADADLNPPTATRAQVYDFLVNELETAVPQLTKAVNTTTYGRMQYYAGQTLLAKLYLNAEVYKGTAEWSKAISACDEVINSGAYRLEENYFTNFNVDNSQSAENIFVVPYDEVSAKGFNLAMITLHYLSQDTWNFTAQPQNGWCALERFYYAYEDTDLRKGIWGDQRTRGNFIAGPQYGADGITPLVDPEASDPDGSPVNFTPQVNEHFPNALRQAGVRIGKFEFKIGGGTDMSNDFPIFRYADVLLMQAEALWRQNQDPGRALALLNQIRTRAGIANYTAMELTAANLLAERGRELFYENHRRTDLIRFGKYNDTWDYKPASSVFKNIFPIPKAQLDANVNLIQNPGY